MSDFIINEYPEEKLVCFMGMLKECYLDKEEIFAICAMIKSEKMILDIANRLKEKYPELTHQETMNIIGQVIEENQ